MAVTRHHVIIAAVTCWAGLALSLPHEDLKQTVTPLQETPRLLPGFSLSFLKSLIPGMETVSFSGDTDTNDSSATDAMEDSVISGRHGNLLPHAPMSVDSQTPDKEAPVALWKTLLGLVLKGNSTASVVDNDIRKDGGKEEEINAVSNPQTLMKSPSLLQIISTVVNAMLSYSTSNSLSSWVEGVAEKARSLSTSQEAKKFLIPQNVLDDLAEIGFTPYPNPPQKLGLSKSDAIKLAINWLAMFGLLSLFWRAYLPVPGYKFNDYDYSYEEYDDGYEDEEEEEEEEEEEDHYGEEEEDHYGEEEEDGEDDEDENYYYKQVDGEPQQSFAVFQQHGSELHSDDEDEEVSSYTSYSSHDVHPSTHHGTNQRVYQVQPPNYHQRGNYNGASKQGIRGIRPASNPGNKRVVPYPPPRAISSLSNVKYRSQRVQQVGAPRPTFLHARRDKRKNRLVLRRPPHRPSP